MGHLLTCYYNFLGRFAHPYRVMFQPTFESPMRIPRCLLSLGILLGGISALQATNIGFGNLGGSNTRVPSDLGSFASTDGNGYVVSLGGPTPNIRLEWDPDWDIHTSDHFTPLENKFEGGGAWDNQGNVPRIGQLDFGFHTIQFHADPGYALVLTSFDFALTGENLSATTSWKLTLTSLSEGIDVWTQTVDFTVEGGVSDVRVITPDFTGEFGESYILTFERTSQSFNSDGRHGIDNLQFSQVAVPEPGTVALLASAGLGLLFVTRRRSK